MSDAQSIQFRNKSISQLVHQLNQLGDDHVMMHPTTLIAVQDQSSQSIRRFRSKSIHKSRTTQTQFSPSSNKQIQMSQFFLVDGSQKKYYYDQITNDLETLIIGNVLNKYQQNFNTALIMQYKQDRFHQLLYKIQPWIQASNIDKQFYASFIQYRTKQAIDLLASNTINVKSMSLSEAEKTQQMCECTIQDIMRAKNLNQNYIKILKIEKKSNKNKSQIRIILLPSNIFLPNIQDPSLKIVKSQLFQIINYIKVNPNKKYQNINKLLPKRYPTTTAIATILLYDTVNYVINWVTDCKENKSIVNGRFQFYSKISGISNLVKRVQDHNRNRKIVKINRNISKSPKPTKQITSTTDLNRIPQQKKINLEGTQARSMSQLQYCRSFQRKTHKYSIAQFDSVSDERLFPETLPYYPQISPQLNESQVITVLKAQHARQISQYHQTIQNLNQKILILTSEKGMSQIFTIHERQIMLLQLKIEQLRKDISKMCATPSKQKDTQNLKDIIKKLNQEIATIQKTNPSHKLSQGKIKMMEHQLSQWKEKYQKSEIARKQLRLQLQAATNRLRIKDEQTKKLMQKEEKTYKDEDLSAKQMSILQQIQQLSKNGLNKENAKYVCRKFKNILGNLSQLRQTILQCHNFLVDLQDHIQSRLSQKDPDVVLDCNRFIRTYLLNNLNIL